MSCLFRWYRESQLGPSELSIKTKIVSKSGSQGQPFPLPHSSLTKSFPEEKCPVTKNIHNRVMKLELSQCFFHLQFLSCPFVHILINRLFIFLKPGVQECFILIHSLGVREWTEAECLQIIHVSPQKSPLMCYSSEKCHNRGVQNVLCDSSHCHNYLKRKWGVIRVISTTGNLENFDESKPFLISNCPWHKRFILCSQTDIENSFYLVKERMQKTKTHIAIKVYKIPEAKWP